MSATNFQKLQQFHAKFDPDAGAYADLLGVRQSFLDEEVREVAEAMTDMQANPSKENKAHLVKELIDVLYVTYGTLVLLGVNADAAFEEVHKSNMSKQANPGGKLLKGPEFYHAQMEQFVS